jgi:cell shape-determining protein MreC
MGSATPVAEIPDDSGIDAIPSPFFASVRMPPPPRTSPPTRSSRTPVRLWQVVVCSLFVVGGSTIGSPIDARLNTALRDVLTPGLTAAVRLRDMAFRSRGNEPTETRLTNPTDFVHKDEMDREKARYIAVMTAMQDRINELKAAQRTLPSIESPALISHELVSARVLKGPIADRWRSQAIVGATSSDLVFEDAIVLRDKNSLIDLGRDLSLSPDLTVLAGSQVMGRLAQVGRWSSSLQLITHPEYSSRIRIVRPSPRGVTLVGEGTLRGDGAGRCRIQYAPLTAAVQVGDAVLTPADDQSIPAPMWFGTVVEVDHRPHERHWTIIVEPRLNLAEAETVQVVRPRLNPDRAPGPSATGSGMPNKTRSVSSSRNN